MVTHFDPPLLNRMFLMTFSYLRVHFRLSKPIHKLENFLLYTIKVYQKQWPTFKSRCTRRRIVCKPGLSVAFVMVNAKWYTYGEVPGRRPRQGIWGHPMLCSKRAIRTCHIKVPKRHIRHKGLLRNFSANNSRTAGDLHYLDSGLIPGLSLRL